MSSWAGLSWVGWNGHIKLLDQPIPPCPQVTLPGTALWTFALVKKEQVSVLRFRHVLPRNAYHLDRPVELSWMHTLAHILVATGHPCVASSCPCCSLRIEPEAARTLGRRRVCAAPRTVGRHVRTRAWRRRTRLTDDRSSGARPHRRSTTRPLWCVGYSDVRKLVHSSPVGRTREFCPSNMSYTLIHDLRIHWLGRYRSTPGRDTSVSRSRGVLRNLKAKY